MGEVKKRRFSTTRKTEEVEIDDKLYTLREMEGEGLSYWTNLNSNRLAFDKNGAPAGMKDVENLHAKLICLCLYGPDGKAVDEKVIASWPSSVQRELFVICQEMNGIDKDSQEAEKKG